MIDARRSVARPNTPGYAGVALAPSISKARVLEPAGAYRRKLRSVLKR